MVLPDSCVDLRSENLRAWLARYRVLSARHTTLKIGRTADGLLFEQVFEKCEAVFKDVRGIDAHFILPGSRGCV